MGTKGWKLSKETKQRMSVAQKGHKGIKHTPEAKEKIRKAQLGKIYSPETIKRISEAKIQEEAGYGAIHDWVRRWKGTPNICESCGAKDRYMNWANIDHQYKRILDDYIRLCVPCHRKFDLNK